MAPTRSLAAALFLSLSIFSEKSRADGSQQCYFTNGKEATGYFPCNPDAESSACCNGAAGYTCLSNTLCKGPKQELVRATCTDPTWRQGGGCKRYCFGVWDSPANILHCENDGSNETGANYCCQDQTSAGSQWYWFTPQDLAPVAAFDSNLNRYVALTTTTTKTTPTAVTVTVINGTPQGTATGTLMVTVSITVPAGSVKTTETVNPSPTSGPPKKESNLPPGVWAGIGIGAFVVVVLISVLGFVLWRRHRSKQPAVAEMEGSAPGNSGRGGFFRSSRSKWRPGFNELPTDSDTSELDNKSTHRGELPTGIDAAEMDAKGLDRQEMPTGLEASEMEAAEKRELPASVAAEYGRTEPEVYAGPPPHYFELPAERYY